MQIRDLGLIVSFLLIGMSMSACSKESDSDMLVRESTDGGRVEDRFGKGFGEAFRADPNSEPAVVDRNDVNPVSLTDEPEPID
jgi:hypothetical protein